MKLEFSQSKAQYPSEHIIGVNLYKYVAQKERFRWAFGLVFEIGRYTFKACLWYGKRNFAGPLQQVLTMMPGAKVVCRNSEETCQLREGKEYIVESARARYDRCDANEMTVEYHLKGMDSHVYYEWSRFDRVD